MSEKKTDKALKVITLGGFSMSWDGKRLGGGAKSADSQFTRLMQILLHCRDTGVDRLQLQELLFADSKSDDIHHLLRSDIYNTRKKLRKAGLPESSYIEYRNGKYYWTGDIEVEEDAALFEALCNAAEEEEDPDRKCEMLMEACFIYTGEFLPMQSDLLWVAHEAKKYREMFLETVEQAAGHLRDSGRYKELASLGRHAAAVCPLSDLEILIIEPLVSMGRLREAYELYDYTISQYQDELGLEGTQGLMLRMENIISGADRPNTELADIVMQMEEDDTHGGYVCSYPAFRSIYRIVQRSFGRTDVSAYIMLCKFTDMTGWSRLSEEDYKDKANTVREAICRSVRKSDIICRYGRGQYLILIMHGTEEGCKAISSRIRKNLKADRIGRDMDFQYAPIEKLPEDENFAAEESQSQN